MTAAAFYSVAGIRFFVGMVALLNSLRMVGHREPFHLVDAGLTTEQRAVLESHVVLIPAPEGTPAVFLTLWASWSTRPTCRRRVMLRDPQRVNR